VRRTWFTPVTHASGIGYLKTTEGKVDFVKQAGGIIRVVMPVRLAVIFTMNAVEGLSLPSPLPIIIFIIPPFLWKLYVSPRATRAVPLAAFPPDAPIFKFPKSVFQVCKIDRFSEPHSTEIFVKKVE